MSKAEIRQKISDSISLNTKIKVLNEFAFIDLLTELGYRKDKMWSEDEQPILDKLIGCANKHMEDIMELLSQESVELSSLKQSIIESPLYKFFPKKEMSFHDKVVFAIASINEELEKAFNAGRKR